MFEWLLQYKQAFIIMAWLSLALLLISVLVIPWLIINLPSDYFQHRNRHAKQDSLHPVLKKIILAVKNVIGFMLIILGLLMIALPGQGLLTIFAGLVMMNFPGKYKYERKLVGMPKVLDSLNWIRKKANKDPLVL